MGAVDGGRWCLFGGRGGGPEECWCDDVCGGIFAIVVPMIDW